MLETCNIQVKVRPVGRTGRFIILFLTLCYMTSHAASTLVSDTYVLVQGRAVHDAKGWLATWPGVSWTMRFRGTAVGVRLTDSVNHYAIVIDNATAKQISPQNRQQTVWIRHLAEGEHQIELIKRTESPRHAGRFSGFLLADGSPLPSPAASARQIEFIGNSFTAGLGNLSDLRECSEATFLRFTDASQAFPMLTARALDASWQINAMSGMGLIRNWNGQDPHHNYLTYYNRELQTEADVAPSPAWKPKIIVLGIGINDFSTPIQPAESRTVPQLASEFTTSYRRFLAKLRENNPPVIVIATAIHLYPDDALRPLVRQIVEQEQSEGYAVHYLEWQNLDLKGCVWHPSRADHLRMTSQLLTKIAQIGNIW